MCNIIAQQNTTILVMVTKISFLDFGKLSHVQLCFTYTLNRKSTITSNENRARTELLRQQFKKVANSSKISRRIL